MKKQAQFSLIDFLMLQQNSQGSSNPSADALYEAWQKGGNQISDKVIKSSNMSEEKVSQIINSGLARQVGGGYLKVTKAGEKALKTMILGDDRSTFDKEDKEYNYKIAESNIKRKKKTANKNKIAEQLWWDRFNGEDKDSV